MSDALTKWAEVGEVRSLAKELAASVVIQMDVRNKAADVLAIMLTGRELGFGPMQAVRGIVIIKGRPSLYADAMSALVQGRRDVCRYFRCVESTEKVATFETLREGHPEPQKLSYTMEDATRAGLAGQDNYRKHPKAMLRARCIGALCRMVYPDLVMGFYTPEEVEAMPEEKDVTPSTVSSTLSEKLRAELVTTPRPSPPAEAEVVEAPPQPTPPPAPKAPTPYDNLVSLCKLEEVPIPKAMEWVKSRRGLTRMTGKQVEQADVDAYREALNEEARMEEAAKDEQESTPF